MHTERYKIYEYAIKGPLSGQVVFGTFSSGRDITCPYTVLGTDRLRMASRSATDPHRSNDPPAPGRGIPNEMVPSPSPASAAIVAEARHALDTGDFLDAHALATTGLQEPIPAGAVEELQNVLVLSLLEMGWLEKAQDALAAFDWRPDSNVERTCRIGRLYRELALRETSSPQQRALLGKAFEAYQKAFDASGDHYPGVNTAFLAALLGESTVATRIAAQLVESCDARAKTPSGAKDFWVWASLGEAHAILAHDQEAAAAYAAARKLARGRVRDLIATRRRANLITTTIFGRADLFDSTLHLPALVVFSGHMLHDPVTGLGRLHPDHVQDLRLAIERRLDELDAELGFASAACGADILFLEAMVARGSAIHVVLPWKEEQFIRSSVGFSGNGAWVDRFKAILKQATSVRILAQDGMPESAAAHEFSGRMLVGLGLLMAQDLGLDVKPLAVWDGEPGRPGGTGGFVSLWRSLGREVAIIRCPRPTKDSNGVSPPSDQPQGPLHHEVKTLLFADVAGYSRLTETQVAIFVATVLKDISQLIDGSRHAPVFVNTWGDGLFMVFDSAEHGGKFALELAARFKQYNASPLGLPTDLSVRIALHCGPVLVGPDPIVRAIAFNGSHVSRAARIEPVVEPGAIFVSEEFAAAAMTEAPEAFAFESLGNVTLAKDSGTCHLFSLQTPTQGTIKV